MERLRSGFEPCRRKREANVSGGRRLHAACVDVLLICRGVCLRPWYAQHAAGAGDDRGGFVVVPRLREITAWGPDRGVAMAAGTRGSLIPVRFLFAKMNSWLLPQEEGFSVQSPVSRQGLTPSTNRVMDGDGQSARHIIRCWPSGFVVTSWPARAVKECHENSTLQS